jgi:uncharacterized protein (TIGR02421 family)
MAAILPAGAPCSPATIGKAPRFAYLEPRFTTRAAMSSATTVSSPRPSDAFLTAVRELSDRMVEAQRPIRILNSIQWDEAVGRAFIDGGCRDLPVIGPDWYQANRPLGFDPESKREEFQGIERDLVRRLGQLSPLGAIMRRICREYRAVVEMLETRGTSGFGHRSQELYGSAADAFHAGDPTLAELGEMMEATLGRVSASEVIREEPRVIPAQEAVRRLGERLQAVYPGAGLRVRLSDGIAADAAAGTDYIKLREGALFSEGDLRVLEVHEGWVHLGTTINGMNQPWLTFLGKGPPSATVTQEGLAVLTEVMTLSSTPDRLHRLVNRVRAITLAEQGADFMEVFRFFCAKGNDHEESFKYAARVFRGTSFRGPPFTKDIAYIKGFVLTYNFLRLAIAQGKLDRVRLLFAGKTVIEDMKVLSELLAEGVLAEPRHVPPLFADLRGLAAMLSFSRFLTGLDYGQLEADYAGIL